MSGRFVAQSKQRLKWSVAGAVMLAALWGADGVRAQSGSAAETPAASPASQETTGTTDGGVVQAGCASCGGGVFGSLPPLSDPVPGQTEAGCGGTQCFPGLHHCDCCCNCDSCVGKFFCGVYECICCPDPCYHYKWTPVQDSAFFVDSVRPVTQMVIRVDSAWNFANPDRGEFFMARQNTIVGAFPANTLIGLPPGAPATTNQVGPGGPCAPPNVPGKGPLAIASKLNYEDLSVYMESGTDKAGMFIQTSYREIDPTNAGISAQVGSATDTVGGTSVTLPAGSGVGPVCNVSGFADLIIGAKSVILDCELIQLGTEFKTYIPAGNFTKGLGTGHVSLEPSILATVKLAPTWYMQLQTSYWIPVGGDMLYDSNVWHNHVSLNHVLWCPCHDVQLVGTLEANEWTFFQGAYTETAWLLPISGTVTVPAGKTVTVPGLGTLGGGTTVAETVFYPVAIGGSAVMASIGPGLRLFICDKIDIGVGTAFAVTGRRMEEEIVRTEFRWRF